MISFAIFFETLKNKNVSQTEIIKNKIVPPQTLQNMRNNGKINTSTIDRICNYLEVTPDQVFTWYPDTATNIIAAKADPTPEELTPADNPKDAAGNPPKQNPSLNEKDPLQELQQLQLQLDDLKKKFENM